MNRAEMQKLLVQISYIDNRIIDDYTVEMWHRTIPEDVTYIEAATAVPIAFAESDAYVTPNRILQIVKRMRQDHATRNQHVERLQIESAWHGDEPPKCAEHETSIMKCKPCQHRLSVAAEKMSGDRLNEWADENIY
jgi:hypothetical protein